MTYFINLLHFPSKQDFHKSKQINNLEGVIMKLLTDELRQQIPKLYSQEETPSNKQTVYAKFFFPAGNWTWFVTEGEAQENGDFMFFGYVIGFEEEWGYFSLNELENINVNGLKVERDLFFKPGTFSDVIKDFKNL